MKPVECPCGGASPERRTSDRAPLYAECCGRFIEGGALPGNAMELMRSRYTAYVLGNTPYLRMTWARKHLPRRSRRIRRHRARAGSACRSNATSRSTKITRKSNSSHGIKPAGARTACMKRADSFAMRNIAGYTSTAK